MIKAADGNKEQPEGNSFSRYYSLFQAKKPKTAAPKREWASRQLISFICIF
jgi:hypothetical protein